MLQKQHKVLNASDTPQSALCFGNTPGCLMLQAQHRMLNASNTPQGV